jgi:RNA polymerase sigma factor (sigma-70 family)
MKLFRNSSKNLSDEDIIARFKETGNAAVLGIIFNRYFKLVYGVCLKYHKNSTVAEDETMAVFEKLIIDLQKHHIRFFRPWFFKYTKNHCLMELRRKKPHIITYESFHQPFHETELTCQTTDLMKKDHLYDQIDLFLGFLKPEQETCLRLFYMNNKSYKDVSACTGIPLNQVRSYIQNGKRKLKIHFEKYIQNGYDHTI